MNNEGSYSLIHPSSLLSGIDLTTPPSSQKDEIIRCSTDLTHFVQTHIKVPSQCGLTGFIMNPQNEKVLQSYNKDRQTYVLSRRLTGLSTTTSAYLLWRSIFSFSETILILAPTLRHGICVLDQIKQMHTELPDYMKQRFVRNTKDMVEFDNGTKIMAVTETTARGISPSLVVFSDLAHFTSSKQEAAWHSLYPVISFKSCDCIIATSVGAPSHHISQQIWEDANKRHNTFHPIMLTDQLF